MEAGYKKQKEASDKVNKHKNIIYIMPKSTIFPRAHYAPARGTFCSMMVLLFGYMLTRVVPFAPG